MSQINVNFGDLLKQTGGDERLSDQFRITVAGNLTEEQQNIIFDGQDLDGNFEGDAGFATRNSRIFDASLGFADENLNDPAVRLLAGGQVGKIFPALTAIDAAQNAAAAYQNIEQAQEMGGIAGGLVALSGTAETAGNALESAAGGLSLLAAGAPVFALPAATLSALGTALSEMGGNLKDEALKVAEELRKLLDGNDSSVTLPGVDLNDPAQRDCVEKLIEDLEGKQGKQEEEESERDQEVEANDGEEPDSSGPNQDLVDSLEDPLVLDLDGDGVELTAEGDPSVYFSFDGGIASFSTGWISPDDGIVVKDLNDNGVVDSAEEFFGDSTIDAFTDLATFDENADGVVDYLDPIWEGMKLWRDLNQSGEVDDGELVSMGEAGIASIGLTVDASPFPSAGSTVAATGSYTRTDGQTGEAWAVFLDVSTTDSVIDLPPGFEPDPDALGLPELRGLGRVPALSVAMSLDPDLKGQVQFLAENAATLTGGEFRTLFEQMFLQWGGFIAEPRDDEDYSDFFYDGVVDRFAGQDIQYVEHTLFDLGYVSTSDAQLRYNYNTILDQSLLRFAIQLPNFDLSNADTPEALDAALNNPFLALSSMTYDVEANQIGGWVGFPIVDVAVRLTGDLLSDFAIVDKVMPVLRAVRDDYYRPPPLADFLVYGDREFNQVLWKEITDTFDNAMVADFAFNRTLASSVNEGTDGDDFFDPEKPRLVFAAGRDYTYFDGREGDDTFVSRPWSGPFLPSSGDIVEYTGTQNATLFLYREGDGNDTIDLSEATGRHVVYLPNLVSTDAVFAVAEDGGGDALLTFSGGGSILFQDIGVISEGSVEIQFADGIILTQDDVRLQFTDFDDVIVGDGLANVMFGGLGDDELRGEGGNDTYIYRRGDGHDTIIDPFIFVIPTGPNIDTLVFEGINSDEATFERVSWDSTDPGFFDVIITFNGHPDDSVTLKDHLRPAGFFGGDPAPTINQFQFADGILILDEDARRGIFEAFGTDGDDVVLGTPVSETLFFSNGNDILSGGGGSDVYLRQPNVLGDDTIDERSSSLGDRLVLEDILPEDVVLSLTGGEVTLTLPTGSVTILGQRNRAGPVIEEIEFSDGTVWDPAEITSRLVPTSGTGETIPGTSAAETLGGTFGDDTLDGMGGGDTLQGGRGSDLYVYAAGYGNDTIEEVGDLSSLSIDRLDLRGLDPDDVELTRLPGRDLSVRIVATGEELLIDRHFESSLRAVDEFLFADGTVWNAGDIADAATVRGTVADETIIGSNDGESLNGAAGDDRIEGRGGADTYIFRPGDGQDTLVDAGANSVIEIRGVGAGEIRIVRDGAAGFGRDAILYYGALGDSIRILNQFSDNLGQRPVSAIQLDTGPAILIGALQEQSEIVGTESDDTISGTPDDDVIDGLAGDDTLRNSAGDDVYIWGPGKGSDNLREISPGVPLNTLRITDATLSDLAFERPSNSTDLIVTLVASGEMFTIEDQFADTRSVSTDNYFGIAKIELADGTSLNRDALLDLAPIRGTPGTELLSGGRGTDAYAWGTGQGDDIIDDRGRPGEINVVLLEGLVPADVSVARAGGSFGTNGFDLAITITATGEILTIRQQLVDPDSSSGRHITEVRFSDGSTLDLDSLAATLPFIGTDGDDTLFAAGQFGILDGGAGDDELSGSTGADTYRWSPGDGNDVILEQTVAFVGDGGGPPIETVTPILGDGDVLDLSAVQSSDVELSRAADHPQDLIVSISISGQPDETIRVAHQFVNPLAGIEQIVFADLTMTAVDIIDAVASSQGAGTASDDTLIGGWNADVFTPGKGDDLIFAYGGADTITIGADSGVDTIHGFRGGPLGTVIRLEASPFADFDALLAAATLGPDGVRIELGGGIAILLDGVLLSDIEPENFGFERAPIMGTERDEGISGTLLDDRIFALDGDDVIYGRAGDDMIDGGGGYDVVGYLGVSTDYSVTVGAGSTTIIDLNSSDGDTGTDTITNAEQLRFGDDVVISLGNAAPVAATTGNEASGDEDSVISGALPAASDPDDDNPLTYSVSGPTPDGLALSADGTFIYTPEADFNGLVSFDYLVSDPSGAASAPARFEITVAGVNDAPVLVSALLDQTSPEDAVFSFELPEDAFFDVDSALSFSATLSSGATLPDWIDFDAADRRFSGTPRQDFNGALDITVVASDGEFDTSSTFTFDVTPVNDAPMGAVSLSDQMSPEDQPVSIVLPSDAFTDVDGDTLTLTAALADDVPLPNWLSFDPDAATFTGMPPQDFNGTLDVVVTANDGRGGDVSSTFALTVDPVNDDPVANDDDGFSVDENTSVDIAASTLLDNDTDVDGDDLSIVGVSNARNGSVVLSGETITFTADGGSTGSAGFDYTLSDGSVEDSAAVSLSVEAVEEDAYADYDIQGTGGRDTLVGRFFAENSIFGAGGTDVIFGGLRDDKLAGGAGGDRLYGRWGDDLLEGNEGDDRLLGGFGDDLLKGGTGRDTLIGGWGMDIFFFGEGDGQDVVGDFSPGQSRWWWAFAGDKLAIDVDGVETVEDVLGAASRQGRNTVFDFGEGDELIVRNIRPWEFDADDFILG